MPHSGGILAPNPTLSPAIRDGDGGREDLPPQPVQVLWSTDDNQLRGPARDRPEDARGNVGAASEPSRLGSRPHAGGNAVECLGEYAPEQALESLITPPIGGGMLPHSFPVRPL